MITIEAVKMIVALSKSLPTEFTSSQYRNKFYELNGLKHCSISPSIDTLRKCGLAVKVREEMIPITETYEEYYFADGFTIPADEWENMRFQDMVNVVNTQHGGIYPRWRERPDLPPVKICDGKRYYYKFDLEKLRDAMREITETIKGLGL